MVFTIDTAQKGTSFPHYWEMCVGSCHAYTALRADWQVQMKKAHDELGFQYVRFHGLFCDDMSVCIETKTPFTHESLGITYNFINIDKIFDFLLSIGMKPFIELGFMPAALASGTKECFHYHGNITPPKDYAEWEKLVHALTEHLVERYGLDEVRQWYFEVWNEPNLAYFWAGTQQDYFDLYAASVRAIKSVDSALRVGGPATSINAWLPDMIAYCKRNDLPLDYLSTHHYPSDDPLWRSGMDIMDFFAAGGAAKMGTYERGILRIMTEKAREEAGSLPLIYTEWNISAVCGEALHDEPYAATMLAKVLADNDGLVQGYSFWTVSDIFEESAQLAGVFHGGFGLQTCDGVPKPAYRLFEIFHALGNERLAVKCGTDGSTLELLAVRGEGKLHLVLHNHQVPGEPVKDETCTVAVNGLKPVKSVTAMRIDNIHANAKNAWAQMGKPAYLSSGQVAELVCASELKSEPVSFTQNGDTVEICLTIPAQGCCALEIIME